MIKNWLAVMMTDRLTGVRKAPDRVVSPAAQKKPSPVSGARSILHLTVNAIAAPYFAAVFSLAMSASLRSVMTPIMLSR